MLSISINLDALGRFVLLLLLLLFLICMDENSPEQLLPHFMHFFQLICLVASCPSLLPDPVTLWPTSNHTAVSSRVPCALWLLSQPLSLWLSFLTVSIFPFVKSAPQPLPPLWGTHPGSLGKVVYPTHILSNSSLDCSIVWHNLRITKHKIIPHQESWFLLISK